MWPVAFPWTVNLSGSLVKGIHYDGELLSSGQKGFDLSLVDAIRKNRKVARNKPIPSEINKPVT
ncbi:MAG TPA: hypothetical protein DEF89_21115 [Desulfosporosinus sp.]|nr:hypothetical protein [Desulfosporosinus sp.]